MKWYDWLLLYLVIITILFFGTFGGVYLIEHLF